MRIVGSPPKLADNTMSASFRNKERTQPQAEGKKLASSPGSGTSPPEKNMVSHTQHDGENQREASDATIWLIGQPAPQSGAEKYITAPSPTSTILPACSPPSDLVNNLMADESV